MPAKDANGIDIYDNSNDTAPVHAIVGAGIIFYRGQWHDQVFVFLSRPSFTFYYQYDDQAIN